MTHAVLEAAGVSKHFTVTNSVGSSATVRAVENASIRLVPGRITAVVGESGSGKTTLARLLARFYEPTSGEILLDGNTVSDGRSVQKQYRKDVQLIFQDPFGSLNSLHRVRHNLERALSLHHEKLSRAEREARMITLLERVSLSPAREFLDKFPHELSGGQRQRVVIARALAVGPRVLLGDEPISMLDVSIRLEMLNLLNELCREDGLAMLYITHDIASARYLCDDIVVMYAGQMVEAGPKDEIISRPQHPYTKLLVESSPDPHRDTTVDRDEIFAAADELGEPPSLIDPPSGCRFHPRCPLAMEQCLTTAPPRVQLDSGRWADCWLHDAGRADELSEHSMTELISRRRKETR
ncbi:peptide/nickel transport system ATP-binding protein [Microbacterium endophyticum]|uniref:Peptide/nickel transport system ATP-binding protein n=1 Tax=Microbacterium endophyticum TaxID=1526412 RepID=A0A7W4V5E5_9MICO|nr:ABC transporter ATP-binding protein [Microbacterium endophyticum]MBB2976610.1 peptide/nickel transport system ATP-binding protein [Microbacterium endophyticum]NIK37507.1 peptide/nickel transport system ATP-binding protein [Microbacterium endophyticum]